MYNYITISVWSFGKEWTKRWSPSGFVSSVFVQMDTDIIGSVLFTIRRSLMSCMLRMLFRVRRTLFYVNSIEWHNYVKYLNVKLIYIVYVQHCIGILAVVFQLYSVYTKVHVLLFYFVKSRSFLSVVYVVIFFCSRTFGGGVKGQKHQSAMMHDCQIL